MHEGVDYSPVFDATYYLDNNSDLKSAFGTDNDQAFLHFLYYGMAEGRQAKASFNPFYYRINNSDLAGIFGEDLKSYYLHYINYGINEGRVGDKHLGNGVYYSPVIYAIYYLITTAI
jgi:hypothetical protein